MFGMKAKAGNAKTVIVASSFRKKHLVENFLLHLVSSPGELLPVYGSSIAYRWTDPKLGFPKSDCPVSHPRSSSLFTDQV